VIALSRQPSILAALKITRAADAERWREVSVSTDVNAAVPLPPLRF